MNVDYDLLHTALLTPQDQTIDMSDAEVYIKLQELIPIPPTEDDAYYDKQAAILSKSYKKTCMINGFNFK
jgi:hypothetical protein